MHRALRYLLAIGVALGVTLVVAVVHDSVVLLAGIFVVYALSVAIALRYPELLWGGQREPRRGNTRLASSPAAGRSAL